MTDFPTCVSQRESLIFFVAKVLRDFSRCEPMDTYVDEPFSYPFQSQLIRVYDVSKYRTH